MLYSQSRHPLAAANGGHRQRMGLGLAMAPHNDRCTYNGAKDCAALRATLLSDSLAGELGVRQYEALFWSPYLLRLLPGAR
jgi:hypothetical protein